MNSVEIRQLNHQFDKQNKILHDLSISVPKGSIYGFLGPNGAGKTTTLRLVLGLLKRQVGSIKVFEKEMSSNRINNLKNIGSLIEMPSLYGHLTAKENLEIYRKLYNLSKERVQEVLEIVDLAKTGKKKVKGFSLGMKQRLSIAIALLHSPELLILDEPTNGLDPNGIIEMRNLLKKLNEENGTTIMISSHLLPEIEKIATHVGIIHHGKMLFEGTMNDLQVMKNVPVGITYHVSDLQKAKTLFEQNSWSFTQENEFFQTAFETNELVAKQIKSIVDNGVSVYSCVPKINDLEQIFLDITQN
jgi:lantibiotic transport system ATP-binding protein